MSNSVIGTGSPKSNETLSNPVVRWVERQVSHSVGFHDALFTVSLGGMKPLVVESHNHEFAEGASFTANRSEMAELLEVDADSEKGMSLQLVRCELKRSLCSMVCMLTSFRSLLKYHFSERTSLAIALK